MKILKISFFSYEKALRSKNVNFDIYTDKTGLLADFNSFPCKIRREDVTERELEKNYFLAYEDIPHDCFAMALILKVKDSYQILSIVYVDAEILPDFIDVLPHPLMIVKTSISEKFFFHLKRDKIVESSVILEDRKISEEIRQRKKHLFSQKKFDEPFIFLMLRKKIDFQISKIFLKKFLLEKFKKLKSPNLGFF